MSSYFKIDEENFAKIKTDLSRSLEMFEERMSRARVLANSDVIYTDSNRTLEKFDKEGNRTDNLHPQADRHNNALNDLRRALRTPEDGDIVQAVRTVPAMSTILRTASEYNGTDPSEFENISFEELDPDYVPNFEVEVANRAGDNLTIKDEGKIASYDKTERQEDIEPDVREFQKRIIPEPDPDPRPQPEPDPDNSTDKRDGKGGDTTQVDGTDGNARTNDLDPNIDIMPLPNPINSPFDFDSGDTTPEGPGGIIGKTESIVDILVNTDDAEDTGAEMADVVTFGLGGAGSLILGLTTPGNTVDFIEKVSAQNDVRHLENAGLDIFDHPDYINNRDDNAMVSKDENVHGGSNGNGEIYSPEEREAINNSEFSIKQASELEDGEMPRSGNNRGLGKGAAALAGAAAIGGAAAGIAVGIDAEQSKSGEGSYGSSEDYTGEKGLSLGAMFFGTLKDDDPAKQKKQEIMERVAVIVSAASAAAAFGTFILANMDVIKPVWFLVATLMFSGSYVYFDIVKEQKYNRKQELEAMGKIVKTTKPYFGIKDKKLVKVANKKEDINEPDWILLGMSLLSSSAFILKTFDVISWLIFLLLLILFVLIIVVYIILKKKLGEE